jgi:hypothetical protein
VLRTSQTRTFAVCAGMVVATTLTFTSFTATIARAAEHGTWPTPIVGGTKLDVTDDEITALSKALIFELGPGNGKVIVSVQSCDKMPASDPFSYYAGIGSIGDHPDSPVVMACAPKPAAQSDVEHAIGRSMLLAVMDDGEAGPKWKSLFDAARTKDAALAAGVADPYQNQRALVEALNFLIDKHE